MENSYEATTVEMDHSGFNSLKNQILDSQADKSAPKVQSDGQERIAKEPIKERAPSNKKFVFRRGDESLELDDDYELEIMADKRPTRLTLRELRERAAGDIAIKNRMHSLAQEKKKIQSTFKEFSDLAKTDPLGALEFISNKAKETDSEFEYNTYIEKLADQAEKLGKMDEKDRKALELEKKLQKAEQNLSVKEREAAVFERKQQMLSDYPQIGDSQFGEMVEAVLNNEDLMQGLETEHEIMDRVEDLIQETLTQRDIISVIKEINPDHATNNQLIFSLSDQLRQNPDFDEEDVRDILSEIIAPVERRTVRTQNTREDDIRTLSNKARQASPVKNIRAQNSDPYDVLREKLLEHRKTNSKTPLYAR